MANLVAPAPDPLEGREIAGGKYRLEKFRASDELGRVYLARHVKLERPVIVRMLHGSHLSDETLVNRFNRAGLAASRVRHRNVVDVVDLGEEPDGSLYLVSEYIEGRTLAHVIEHEGPCAPHRVVDIIRQIASALRLAHEHGVIHRDLKPEIIQVADQESDDGDPIEVVKVLDFGVAKLQSPMGTASGEQPRHMTIEMISGRPEFMSPEQCNGMKLDARSDLYACGCLAYFLVTGEPPFSGGGLLGVLMKQVKEPVRPPSQLRPSIPASLEAVILKLLAKRPEDRFQSALELRQALDRLDLPRPQGSASYDISLSDGESTVEVGNPDPRGGLDDLPTPAAVSSPGRRSSKSTLMMERPEFEKAGMSTTTKLMIAAVAVAIVIGVVGGLLFGRMYAPDEAAPGVLPSAEAQADSDEDVQP